MSLLGKGTQYDVRRYLWDMYTDEGVSMPDLLDLYDLSDPRDWEAQVDDDHPARNPFERWQAADDHVPDLTDEDQTQWSNGLDHGPHI